MKSKFILVDSSDRWVGLYVDGVLYDQGHEIPLETLALAAGIDLDRYWVDDKWLAERGYLPDNLSEVRIDPTA